MSRRAIAAATALTLAGFAVAPAFAHDLEHHAAIVIDADMGIDDAVALALILQSPEVDIAGVIACEGVAAPEIGVVQLERMLTYFNRSDVPLYAAAARETPATAPGFREFARGAVDRALADCAELAFGVADAPKFAADPKTTHRAFAPQAFTPGDKPMQVLALGPLTNLAAALHADPTRKDRILRIVIPGPPNVEQNWNLRFDPDAYQAVRESGVPLRFVTAGPAGRKPEAWQDDEHRIGPGRSLGESFLRALLADDQVRKHYTQQLANLHDELAVLYLLEPDLFWRQGDGGPFYPNNRDALLAALTRRLVDGRQARPPVVFDATLLPEHVFRKDVRERRQRIIANHGRTEWSAQLLMNELHQHLGAYSIVGVKMGLRAAELLNVPQHGIRVVSHAPPGPPVSCLNDGVIVSTGSTPGRVLFTHDPGPAASTAVTFEYNHRRLTLRLKPEYQQQIRERIQKLVAEYGLENDHYWEEVRAFGLEIWETWDRAKIFAIDE